MREDFLHYIWQFQYFNKHALAIGEGEEIVIHFPGYRNKDQGPDFSNARLLMDGVEWHGNVEIHTKASDWNLHHHQGDKNYDTIVLHVVWENDCKIYRGDGTSIPVLELKDKVDLLFLDKYNTFLNSGIHLPCQYYLNGIPEVYIYTMLDKALSERLERKGQEILAVYHSNQNNWEETFWQVLAGSFGFKINKETFVRLSKCLPYKILMKHSDNLFQLEALLFGQAGMLEEIRDEYMVSLKKEYLFLSGKYSLADKKLESHHWKFLRTRPANFPTVRIAQIAALLSNGAHLINLIYETKTLEEYKKLLDSSVSDYWKSHYRFGEKTTMDLCGLTEATIHSILINVVLPFKSALHLAGQREGIAEEWSALLEKIRAENNKITNQWETAGVKMKNASDSQGGLELYNEYCIKRKCLYCTIGTHIIKR